MDQTYKIIRGIDAADPDQWFDHVKNSERLIRGDADTLSLKMSGRARLELGRNFFSLGVLVVDHWNKAPCDLMRVGTVKAFNSGYSALRKGLVTNAYLLCFGLLTQDGRPRNLLRCKNSSIKFPLVNKSREKFRCAQILRNSVAENSIKRSPQGTNLVKLTLQSKTA